MSIGKLVLIFGIVAVLIGIAIELGFKKDFNFDNEPILPEEDAD